MTKLPPPADEVQGRRADVIQWWMSGEHQLPSPWLPMEERMIHRYFSEQDAFFDWTTKNGLYLEQSKTNRAMFDTAHNRRAFEEQLRRGQGIEYMIIGEPQPVTDSPSTPTTAIWNIRKQNREKRMDVHGRPHDELEVLGTYYMVGENVYQAPSLADVIGNRLLASMTSIDKYLQKASPLTTWTPTTGTIYATLDSIRLQTAANSANHSAARSREGSVAPGVDVQSLRSYSAEPSLLADGDRAVDAHREAHLLAQSLHLAIRYHDEYLDENPVTGEPGHFAFTSSAAAVKKRKADQEAATIRAREIKEALSNASGSGNETARSSMQPAVMSEPRAAVKADRERKRNADKIRRRKSKGGALNPLSPGSTSATVPSSPT